MTKEVYGVIYLVINKINNKIYVGQTVGTFKSRYRGDISNTHNEHLKRSINKYGVENFYICEEYKVAYSKEELDYLEDLYIVMFDTMDSKKGYNKKGGGSNGRLSEETKEKRKQLKDIEFKKSWEQSLIKFEEENGYSYKYVNAMIIVNLKTNKASYLVMNKEDLARFIYIETGHIFSDRYINKKTAWAFMKSVIITSSYKSIPICQYKKENPEFNINNIPIFNPDVQEQIQQAV